MQTTLQVSFVGLARSDAVENRIRDEVSKLEQFKHDITAMRVVVSRPEHSHHKGDSFHVGIHISVPRAPDIAISREPGEHGAHDDVYISIRDTFKAARRQLRDLAAKH
jgi:ribosome-associated translation inhibitor RaiA